MVIFPFPTSWFSRRGENKNPTTSAEAMSGRICFLPQVLNHKWGMEILPWVTNGEFYQSLLLLRWGLTFLYCKWKWRILTFFLLYWPGNIFLYSSALEKIFFSKADEWRKNFSLRLMLKKLWKWSNLTFSLLYWLGKFFLYSWWVEKKIFSTPDENSQIFWLVSAIFHLMVPLVHFHLQYRNAKFWLSK